MSKPMGTLLLLDDEELILEPLRDQLADAGFQVDAFLNPFLALEAFEGGGKHYDLLLTDLSMPGMDGVAFAKKVRKDAENLPVLIMSGYLPDEKELANEKNVVFLLKPFSFETLMGQIQKLLSAPPLE